MMYGEYGMGKGYQLRWMHLVKENYGLSAEGYSYGNPRFTDGHHIWTSQIDRMILKSNMLIIITQNSQYNCPIDELCCLDGEDDMRDMLIKYMPNEEATINKLTIHQIEGCPITYKKRKLGIK